MVSVLLLVNCRNTQSLHDPHASQPEVLSLASAVHAMQTAARNTATPPWRRTAAIEQGLQMASQRLWRWQAAGTAHTSVLAHSGMRPQGRSGAPV